VGEKSSESKKENPFNGNAHWEKRRRRGKTAPKHRGAEKGLATGGGMYKTEP